MRPIIGQFSQVFRTRDGNKFFGELALPDSVSGQSFYRPRRTLITDSHSVLKTGDVVQHSTIEMLVSLQNQMNQTRQFLAFDVTHKLPWTRVVDTIDPVTGLAKDHHSQILDPSLPVVVEDGSTVANMGLRTGKYHILTGSDVKVGDRIGPWLVQARFEILGLNSLEVS